MDVTPNQTIYVNNLYEKLPKEGDALARPSSFRRRCPAPR